MLWMRAISCPHWKASRERAPANSGARAMRAPKVTPSSHSMRNPAPMPSAAASTYSTSGSGTPAARAVLMASASASTPVTLSPSRSSPPGPRRRQTSKVAAASDRRRQRSRYVSMLAPPLRRSASSKRAQSESSRRTIASSASKKSGNRCWPSPVIARSRGGIRVRCDLADQPSAWSFCCDPKIVGGPLRDQSGAPCIVRPSTVSLCDASPPQIRPPLAPVTPFAPM